MKDPKQALLAQISQSRAAMARDFQQLKEKLNVSEKIRSAVRSRPSVWLGSAATAGFLFSRLFGSQRKNGSFLLGRTRAVLQCLKWVGVLSLGLFRILPWIQPMVTAYTRLQHKTWIK